MLNWIIQSVSMCNPFKFDIAKSIKSRETMKNKITANNKSKAQYNKKASFNLVKTS